MEDPFQLQATKESDPLRLLLQNGKSSPAANFMHSLAKSIELTGHGGDQMKRALKTKPAKISSIRYPVQASTQSDYARKPFHRRVF